MPKKATEHIREQGWKIIGGVISVAMIATAASLFNKVATAEDVAEAAMVKIASYEQILQQMGSDTEEIKIAAKEMAAGVTVIKELVIRHDKDIEYGKERHVRIEKRLEKLESIRISSIGRE